MSDILTFETVKQYCAFNRNHTSHPLVGVVDLSRADERALRRMRFNFYTVFLKEVKCGDLRYGCQYYDYDAGTLVFVAPGQVLGEDSGETYRPKGLALVIHPDFLLGSTLGERFHDYRFFEYQANEALHLSDAEEAMVKEVFGKIDAELRQRIDRHTRQLVLSNIELLLNYCVRFYDRQFITREVANQGVVARFERLLHDYFHAGRAREEGLPTVAACAEQLHLSPNYFGDLIKKETGLSPQEHIQAKVIAVAKERIFDPESSISEVAYSLGFAYPQHFTRLFKRVTGVTPGAWRGMN